MRCDDSLLRHRTLHTHLADLGPTYRQHQRAAAVRLRRLRLRPAAPSRARCGTRTHGCILGAADSTGAAEEDCCLRPPSCSAPARITSMALREPRRTRRTKS
nr:unnamed protein product [Callosobruchus analis]